jgi:glucoamylase
VVDAGFLELVRYGVLKPEDPLILDSLRVVDSVLKVDTRVGPCWRRYNHDGFGQRDDGGPYVGWGKGRAWPLLTGERAHYELAAGSDVAHLIRAMEGFACNATSGANLGRARLSGKAYVPWRTNNCSHAVDVGAC